ncbi:MAG: hypothetical protein K9G76_01765 [Bacteroidales bacterium]|nr:hypothetical protein [Bacteroidales bacterium]MCF8403281.1 hypothetical protein [Bacteroidales bacterium]
MRNNFYYVIFLPMLFLLGISGCKQLDLVREAAVLTQPAEVMSSSQIRAYGNIIDLGTSESITDFGFCWAMNPSPTIHDQFYSFGLRSYTGVYDHILTNLQQNTTYYIRAYVKNDGVYYYGKTEQGTTLFSGPSSMWLHYDDGTNDDNGIGLTDGGGFDIAIRFPAVDLIPFNGFRISKIRFFPREGFPVEYSATIWEGSGLPDLMYTSYIPNPNINFWTEYFLPDNYFINASKELWIGIWVQNQPPDIYPAGVDNGPAINGFGNMISMDDGDSWDPLYELNSELDFNWNLQVYVTNYKGEELPLVKSVQQKRLKHPYLQPGNISDQISSAKN